MGSGLAMEKLSIGRVVSETFGIIGRNLVSVGVVALVIAAAVVLLTQGVALVADEDTPGSLIAAGAGALLIAIVVRTIATGGITHVAVSDQNGQRVSVGPAFATGLRLALPLLGLGLVVGLCVGLASILLVVPGLMLAMRWLVAVPARVVECPSLGSSLARSIVLTAGSRWRLFGLAVVLGVLSLVVQGVVVAVAKVMGGEGILVLLLQIIGGTVTTSISATGVAVCYMELRRIREGATPGQLASVFA